MKVVARRLPFQSTTELETKFVPVTVRVKAAPPAAVLEGEGEVAVGAGLMMLKGRMFDVPPAGEGLNTVIGTVPMLVMSLAKIAAFNCVALTKVVVRALPFH